MKIFGFHISRQREPETVEKIVKVREEVKVYFPVGEGVVNVFVAFSRSYKASQDRHYQSATYGVWPREPPTPPEWHGKAFVSCAQAFEECGSDADVRPAKALLHEDGAYVLEFGKLVRVAPKPRISLEPSA